MADDLVAKFKEANKLCKNELFDAILGTNMDRVFEEE